MQQAAFGADGTAYLLGGSNCSDSWGVEATVGDDTTATRPNRTAATHR